MQFLYIYEKNAVMKGFWLGLGNISKVGYLPDFQLGIGNISVVGYFKVHLKGKGEKENKQKTEG